MPEVRMRIFLIIVFLLILCTSACSLKANSVDAKKAFDQGSYHESAEEYQKILKKNPNDSTSRLYLAASYFQLGDLPAAMREVLKVINKNPRHLQALELQSEIAIRAGDYNMAQHALESAILYHPKDIKSYVKLSEIYRAKRQPDRAESLLLSAQTISADQPEIFRELYNLNNEDFQRPKLSYYYLRRYVECAPNRPETGDIRYLLKKMEQEDSTLPKFYINQKCIDQAKSAIKAGRYEDAANLLSQVTEQDFEWSLLMGEAMIETDRPFEAQRVLERFLEKHENDPRIHYLIGWAYFRMDATNQARVHWQRVLQLDPSHKKAQFALEKIKQP